MPIPELIKNNIKTETNEDQKNWEENKKEEDSKKNELAYNKERMSGLAEGGLTSGYYMRNARYKPGVKPLKMKENEI